MRASNERFLTDAGERDVAAGVIRSVGRAGSLQYGPGVPMKAGVYRARWIGTLDGAPSGSIGFVDVWADGRRLARREILGGEAQADRRRLAEVEFVLPEPAGQLDYRIWVDGRQRVVLERVELYSRGASQEE